MDKIDKLPEAVKTGLIEFISRIPVEKYSDKWRAIQIAITMITAPNSFKKGVHVYMSSHDGGREEGAYDIHRMSIKIWPHKIQMKREHEIWNSWNGTEKDELCRYIFPNSNYNQEDFKELMSDTSGLFSGFYSEENTDGSMHSSFYSNYTIETNVK